MALAIVVAGAFLLAQPLLAAAQSAAKPAPETAPPATPRTNGVAPVPAVPAAPAVPGAIVPPPGYVIGPDDVLSIVFWREKDLSAEVVVRPDGKISLPLLDEIEVVGLTPAELREKVMAEANKLVEDANATVVVKQINSRRVFITGSVTKPGVYPLTGPMTVVQLIALAGGLLEFADGDKIKVMRTEKAAAGRVSVQLQTFLRRQGPGAEHPVEARGYGHRAVMSADAVRTFAMLVCWRSWDCASGERSTQNLRRGGPSTMGPAVFGGTGTRADSRAGWTFLGNSSYPMTTTFWRIRAPEGADRPRSARAARGTRGIVHRALGRAPVCPRGREYQRAHGDKQLAQLLSRLDGLTTSYHQASATFIQRFGSRYTHPRAPFRCVFAELFDATLPGAAATRSRRRGLIGWCCAGGT